LDRHIAAVQGGDGHNHAVDDRADGRADRRDKRRLRVALGRSDVVGWNLPTERQEDPAKLEIVFMERKLARHAGCRIVCAELNAKVLNRQWRNVGIRLASWLGAVAFPAQLPTRTIALAPDHNPYKEHCKCSETKPPDPSHTPPCWLLLLLRDLG